MSDMDIFAEIDRAKEQRLALVRDAEQWGSEDDGEITRRMWVCLLVKYLGALAEEVTRNPQEVIVVGWEDEAVIALAGSESGQRAIGGKRREKILEIAALAMAAADATKPLVDQVLAEEAPSPDRTSQTVRDFMDLVRPSSDDPWTQVCDLATAVGDIAPHCHEREGSKTYDLFEFHRNLLLLAAKATNAAERMSAGNVHDA